MTHAYACVLRSKRVSVIASADRLRRTLLDAFRTRIDVVHRRIVPVLASSTVRNSDENPLPPSSISLRWVPSRCDTNLNTARDFQWMGGGLKLIFDRKVTPGQLCG